MSPNLEDYHHIISLPVTWGEMDAAQHVNNTVHLRYSESGRIDLFRSIGFEVNTSGFGDPVGPILAEINCRYKMPLTYPDTVKVGTRFRADTLREFDFWFDQIIWSEKHQRVAAEVKTRLVCYNYQALQKAPVPIRLSQALQAFA